jgi:hypothetical protein
MAGSTSYWMAGSTSYSAERPSEASINVEKQGDFVTWNSLCVDNIFTTHANNYADKHSSRRHLR